MAKTVKLKGGKVLKGKEAENYGKTPEKKVYEVDGRKIKTTSLEDAKRLAAKENDLERRSTSGRNAVDENAPKVFLSGDFVGADGSREEKVVDEVDYGTKGGKRVTVSRKDYDRRVVPTLPRLKANDASRMLKERGLSGFGYDDQLIGLTEDEARYKINELKRGKTDQLSTLTTYSFNPKTLTGAKKTLDTFNFKLKDIMNDSWNSAGTKAELSKGVFESTANEYAKLFNDSKEFDSLYGANLDFRKNVDAFVKAGGDMNAIRSRIAAPVTNPVVGPNTQTTAQYLSMAPQAGDTEADRAALEELVPERQLMQDEITRIAKIPEQYRDLYFGTPEQTGIYQQKRIEAEERKKLLEKKAKEDIKDLRSMARLAIEKNKADLDIEQAEVEENRLAARNYATGMLAKMGALKTTGAAIEKLGLLEQKYQKQAMELRRTTEFANKEIEVKLVDAVNDIEITRDSDILDLREDVTKTQEDIFKEINKLEQDAASKIYSITEKAASELRSQREKYRKEAKALAEKNAKEHAKEVANSTPSAPKVIKETKTNFEAQLDASRGSDHFVDPNVYLSLYKRWINERRGTQKEFLNAFPPKNYVNPDNTWLPSYLMPPKPKSKSGVTADDI